MRPLCGFTRTAPSVMLVFGVTAFEPVGVAVSFEGQDVGGYAVEEPAVVLDHQDAAGELIEGLF